MGNLSYLILGASGSGKTVACRSIIKTHYSNRKVFLQPGGPNYTKKDAQTDYGEKTLILDMKDISTLENCVIVFEDVCFLGETALRKVRYLLNFSCRHKNVRCFLLGHTLYHSDLYSLCPLVSNIYFTGVKSNVRNLTNVLTTLNFDKNMKSQVMKDFQNKAASGIYLKLETNTFKITWEQWPRDESQQKNPQNSKEPKTALDILNTNTPSYGLFRLLPNTEANENILKLILVKLDPRSFDPETMMVNVSYRDAGKNTLTGNISLIDYISFLGKKGGEKLPKEVMILHKYFSKKDVKIPSVFVKNKDLL